MCDMGLISFLISSHCHKSLRVWEISKSTVFLKFSITETHLLLVTMADNSLIGSGWPVFKVICQLWGWF